MGILSRQETPNSVGGGRIMYDNVDDDDGDGDDDDGGDDDHDHDHDHDHDDDDENDDEDEDEDQDDDEDDEVHGDGKWIGFCQFTVTMATGKSFCV